MKQINSQPRISRAWLLLAAFLATILYLAWFIGYFINPQVATHGIASELAVHGQPYAKIYLIVDVINLGIILLLSLMIIRINNSHITRRAAFLYALFGLATMLSTRYSLLCAPSVEQCVMGGDILHRTVIHYSLGMVAGVALFLSALSVSKLLDAKSRNGFRYVLFVTLTIGVLSIVLSLTPLNNVLVAIFQRVYLLALAIYVFAVPLIVSKQSTT